MAAIVSGVISWTTLQLEDRRQQELIYQQYLKQAVEVESDPAKRELLLSFFSRVVKDDSLRAWAIDRRELASENLRDVSRRQAVQGLISSNKTTRWNSAETLVTEFADDPKLISDLTRFVQEYFSTEKLALFNTAVVLEDLDAQGKLNRAQGKLNTLFDLIRKHGGEKAKAKITALQP